MNSSIETTFQRSEDIPASYVGDSLLMLGVNQGQYFSLNNVGARIWELIETPATVSALVTQLVKEFEVSDEVCLREVNEFLAMLGQNGLLAGTTGCPPACA